jgi:site-specific recombinase XerD
METFSNPEPNQGEDFSQFPGGKLVHLYQRKWKHYQLFSDFLKSDVAHGSPAKKTVDTYQIQIRQFFSWCLDNTIDPIMAKAKDIKAYRDYLLNEEYKPGHRYKRTTIALKLQVVKRFFAALIMAEVRLSNPAYSVQAPAELSITAEKIKYLPLQGIQNLLKCPDTSTKGTRDKAIIILMALHGLRVSEVSKITMSDIDLNTNTVSVLGKRQKKRTIYLTKDTAKILDAWLSVRALISTASDRLFISLEKNHHKGRHLSQSGVRKLIDQYLVAIGCKKHGISCHALRHSAATYALEAGASLYAISKMLGHSKITTTQIYADIVDARRNNPTEHLLKILNV